MCGIVGQARAGGRAVERTLIERMCVALEHRGPDSRGIFHDPRVGLGIQRLRVIDLETGDQPVFNEDRTVAVVLNGEIYNYQELRDELRRKGHVFSTGGDTEVIAHLYEEEGPDCVSRLAGMFAFALWDSRLDRLFIARDRVGKKPLFYSLRGGTISFASELAALLEDGEISRDVDPQALDCYFTYTYVPAPMSAFRAVRKLPPGCTLLWHRGDVRIDRYWELDYAHKLDVRSDREAGELVWDALTRAVRRRMIADVPLGAFLSGGVDSSAVVAAMAEASAEPVKTFSIGFENERFDELPYAREISRLFGTDHHELVVRPDAVELLPRLVRHYGEPFADHSAIPSFYLAAMARQHVTVALNGDGGDEAFGGYGRYVTARLLEHGDRVPAGLRGLLAAAGSRVPSNGHLTSYRSRIRRVAGMLPLEPADRYLHSVSRFGFGLRDELYTPDFRAQVDDDIAADVVRRPWLESSATGGIDRMLDVDVQTYLPGDLLMKMDIATMAHALEARSPLLDHEVLELAASLPERFKVRGRNKKIALRAALRGRVPDAILNRQKQGFQVPMADWFRGELKELARDALLSPEARDRGYLRPQPVERLLSRHVAGAEDNSAFLWSLLVFELWHRDLVDAPGARVGGDAVAAA